MVGRAAIPYQDGHKRRFGALNDANPQATGHMRVCFTQTADSAEYRPYLEQSGRSVRAYCQRHGFAYEAYVGVRRGEWPWQASFNRIYLLGDLLAQGRFDWAVYMDADAFVADLAFDLKGYLRKHRGAALVVTSAHAGPHWWDVNDGVMLVNLRHPTTAWLLAQWRLAFEAAYDEARLETERTWSNPDDQEMLQWLLRDNPERRQDVELASASVLNAPRARFVRQMLRSHFSDPALRLQALTTAVEEVLERDTGAHPSREAQIHSALSLVYRATLRRDVDAYGLEHFGMVLDNIGLEAGVLYALEKIMESPEYLGMLPAA